jgi:hypothetical protein
LGSGSSGLVPTREVGRRGLNGGEDLLRSGFEQSEIGLIPDCSGLWILFSGGNRNRPAYMSERTLTTSAIPLENSRVGRVSRKAASIKMYSGCQNAPIKFLPWGVSIAVLPPTLESTMASNVVGI